jgi:CubicO group peptidase (beta-lactamase class C family)
LNNSGKQYGPNANAFGHSGWGGSMGFADPDNQIAIGYVPNQMSQDLNGTPLNILLDVIDGAGSEDA